MKKWWIILTLPLLLAGCGGKETMETVADDIIAPVMAAPREISVELPDGAVAPVLDSEGQQVYLCDGYEIIIETRAAGDLGATIREMSGYDRDELTVMSLQEGEDTRHEFVWTSAGEEGERIGRGVVLDDGRYHYCMSVLRDTGKKSQIVWRNVFASFQLV